MVPTECGSIERHEDTSEELHQGRQEREDHRGQRGQEKDQGDRACVLVMDVVRQELEGLR